MPTDTDQYVHQLETTIKLLCCVMNLGTCEPQSAAHWLEYAVGQMARMPYVEHPALAEAISILDCFKGHGECPNDFDSADIDEVRKRLMGVTADITAIRATRAKRTGSSQWITAGRPSTRKATGS